MGRKEAEPKTPIAARIRELRRLANYEEREPFAAFLGIPTGTLANYERGNHPPDLQALSVFRERLGVDLDWLLFGKGEPFSPEQRRVLLDSQLLRRLGELALRVHRDFGITLNDGAKIEMAGRLYNRLNELVPSALVIDPTAGSGGFLVAALDLGIDQLETELREDLQQARAEPGTGKRLA